MPEWKKEIRQRLAGLQLAPTREAAIIEELAAHLDDRYAELLSSGATETEAERRVLEEVRERGLLARELKRVERQSQPEPIVMGTNRRTNMIADLWQDLLFGARMLMKQPGFTFIAVLTLALGIGANTAIFSVVNAVLLRPLPFTQSERLVMVWEKVRLPNYQNERNAPAPGNFTDWRKGSSTFQGMAAMSSRNFNLTGAGEPLRILGAAVSASLFPVLQTEPKLGRVFTDAEDRPGAARVVVLSQGLWISGFGADPQISGKTIRLDSESYTVLGVMPAAFRFPDAETQLWVPLALTPAEMANHGSHNLQVVARLKDGVSLGQAQAEMQTIADALTAQYPSTNTGVGVNLVPLHEQVVGDVRLALLALLAATGFILLIVCANVANLLLARATARQRELAIRLALGAGRARIVRQLLTESVLLALIGGVLALALAYAGVEVLRLLSPPDLPRVEEIGVNGLVLVFSLGLSALTGIVFGLAPALQASRHEMQSFLKEGARESAPGSRVRHLLVAAEIALGVIVLIGAGLLLRSFVRLNEVRLGFQPENVLTQRVTLRGGNYATAVQRGAFYQRAVERIESLPGVKSAAAISYLPLINARNRTGFTIEGRAPLAPGQVPLSAFRTVTPGYFQTMQIGLRKGRDFSWQDTPEAAPVMIINQVTANTYWPQEDALGKRIKLGAPDSPVPWLTVVGIIEDVREFDPLTAPLPTLYFPALQHQAAAQDWVVRTAQDPLSLAAAARSAIWEIDQDLPVSRVQSMASVRRAATATQQFNLVLMGLFACLALALAVTGVYGVTAYSVAQRTREIGVRMALGAQAADVLRLVLAQSLKVIVSGVVSGVIAALLLTRLMTNLLFSVSPSDPVTFATISLLLIGVALLACWIPARRATKVDPMIALRYE